MSAGCTSRPEYYAITEATEQYFHRRGDCPEGMGWPNSPDALRRFEVMLDVMKPNDVTRKPLHEAGASVDTQPVRLLDFGCGTGHLLEYLQQHDRSGIQYSGVDLSETFIGIAKSKHPNADFRVLDIFEHPENLGQFDYAIINGAFTSKCTMSFETMWQTVQRILKIVFASVRCGLAVNTMSKHVDWERDDLFHLSMDLVAQFLCKDLSRHFVMRNDYGLYEYTTYIYHTRQK